jgi:UDP-N-acetylglucosamine 2-epimerase
LEKLGVPIQRIVTVGSSRFDHLAAFRDEYSPSQSRAYLNIPQDFQYYILFDSNADSRGQLTVQEQSQVTNALGNFAREHPSVALMIKPHPVHRPGWLEALLDYFALPNVFLLDKDMVPYHALNAADLLITKLSTMALEAMLFKKPVISILLDGEERFRIFGEAVARVNSLEALNEVLTMLVSEDGRRADWLANLRKNQENYCKHYFGNNVSESAKIGAAALDKFLTDTLSPQGVDDNNKVIASA